MMSIQEEPIRGGDVNFFLKSLPGPSVEIVQISTRYFEFGASASNGKL
jgi:hypothetical protein